MDATKLRSICGGAVPSCEFAESSLGALVRVELAEALTLLSALRHDGFTFLVDLFATDTGEDIEVTYHVRSLARDTDVYVRAGLPYDGTLPSAWEIYPAAAFPEREAAELFGMRLSGHPNPRRLLTVEGAEPYLRKATPVRTAEEVRAR